MNQSVSLGGGTMDNPRADKVAVVDEVRQRMESADGALLTEYRGLTVAELAELRRELTAAGGDYKVFKNTLVRLAVADTPHAGLSDLLTGPTAIAFVQGDVSAVAKALRDFARTYPNLVVKGGVVGTSIMSAADINILAELPSRDTLLAQFAGALSAPLQQLAGLVQALPRNLAYGISALLEQRQAASGPAEAPAETAEATPVADVEAEAPAETAEAAPAETAEAAPEAEEAAPAETAEAAPEAEEAPAPDAEAAPGADAAPEAG
jgi:large subunit ribosomal protein L10